MNNTTRTEVSAVKAARTHADRVRHKLNNPYIPEDLKKIILRLETLDVLDALKILNAATNLYALKFKEIIQENTK